MMPQLYFTDKKDEKEDEGSSEESEDESDSEDEDSEDEDSEDDSEDEDEESTEQTKRERAMARIQKVSFGTSSAYLSFEERLSKLKRKSIGCSYKK